MPFYTIRASGGEVGTRLVAHGCFSIRDSWDWEDYNDLAQYAILHCANTVPNRRTHQDEVLTTETRRSGFGHPDWCSANLPAGWRWVGFYHVLARPEGASQATSDSEHTCYHCAVRRADTIRTTAPFTRITLAWRGDDSTPGDVLHHTNMPELAGQDSTNNTIRTTQRDESPFASCSVCGRLGHNSRTCENPPKYHDMVGIEVEGRWEESTRIQRVADRLSVRGCRDGSVYDQDGMMGYEYQTNPGTLASALNQLSQLYPDNTGRDCGMHVHVSWNSPLAATLLATPQFYDYFKARWTAWGNANAVQPGSLFWQRLNGRNNYCRVNTADSHQSSSNITSMDRYHQLNFSAWGEHKTIECRLLPMFRSQALAISAVQELIAIFEDYLHTAEIALPVAEAKLEKPSAVKSSTKNGVDGWKVDPVRIVKTIEVNKIEPPAEGMARLVVAGGNLTFDIIKAMASSKKAPKPAKEVKKAKVA